MRLFAIRLLLYFCLLLPFSRLHAQLSGQPPYPTIKEITDKFSRKYSLYSFDSKGDVSAFYRFAKKPDGWWVELAEFQTEKALKGPYLYWSATTQTYQNPPFDESGDGRSMPIPNWVTQDLYTTLPYFGYFEWPSDIIHALEGKKNLRPQEWEWLARAYSEEENRLFGSKLGDYGHHVGREYEVAFDPATLPKDLVAQTVAWMEKEYGAWSQLQQLDPNYPLAVGSVEVKKYHCLMDAYLNLKTVGLWNPTLSILDPIQYPKEILALGKNILNSCPTNAILITNGDTDTYPLLFLQEKMGLRRDVSVLNVGLMETGRYLHYWRNLNQDTPKIQFSCPSKSYSGSNYLYVKVNNELPSAQLNSPFIHDHWVVGGPEFPPNLRVVLPEPRAGETQVMELNFTKSYLINQADLILIDLFYSNLGKRPLCFSHTTDGSHSRPFSNYLQSIGVVNCLFPTLTPGVSAGPSPYLLGDMETNRHYFLKIWDRGILEGTNGSRPFVTGEVLDILFAGNGFAGLGKNAEAKELYSLVESCLTPTIYNRITLQFFLADGWAKINESAKAKSLLVDIEGCISASLQPGKTPLSGCQTVEYDQARRICSRAADLAESLGEESLAKEFRDYLNQ